MSHLFTRTIYINGKYIGKAETGGKWDVPILSGSVSRDRDGCAHENGTDQIELFVLLAIVPMYDNEPYWHQKGSKGDT